MQIPQTTITQTSQQQQQMHPTHPSSNLPLTIPTTQMMTMMGSVERERHESASTDRESEIRRIFDQGILDIDRINIFWSKKIKQFNVSF